MRKAHGQAGQRRQEILEILLHSSSLAELLEIIHNICQNMDISHLNTKTKTFRNFRFIFFGLVSRANTLIDLLLYKCGNLRDSDKSIAGLYPSLKSAKARISEVHASINRNRLSDAASQLIGISRDYVSIHEKLRSISEKAQR